MASGIDSILVGEVWREFGMVAKFDGSAIITGVVNYYLEALTGPYAGKWWDDANSQTAPWSSSPVGNPTEHKRDGNWIIKLTAPGPFQEDIMYFEDAEESGKLHVPGTGRLLRGQIEIDEAELERLIAEGVRAGKARVVLGPRATVPVSGLLTPRPCQR